MTPSDHPDANLHTERLFAATPAQVFAAFEQGDRLAQWWGPSGFTNRFQCFEFRPGGRWVFVMRGPDGTDYANECVFRELVAPARIVIEHVVPPWFRLTVVLAAQGGQTLLRWDQTFASPEVAAGLRAVCEPANEQNLDRLAALLARGAVA